MITGRGIHKLIPDQKLRDVSQITPAFLHAHGWQAVIFDIDNTLVPPGAAATETVKAYFAGLQAAGIRTYLISNNEEERVAPFAESLSCGFTCKAGKPSGRGYLRALQALALPKEAVLAVGDQLFTDIWGASRAGLFSILVDAVDPAHEQPFVRVKRISEKILLFFRKNRINSVKD